jgi:diguanylate cyclase (GGDEF)-like protein/PAS domain S-box-containing protein
MVGAIAIDITDRLRAEEALLLRDRAIEASVNPIVIVDSRAPGMPITYVNPAFERVTGYSSAEAVGRNSNFLQKADGDQPDLEKIRAAILEQREGHGVLRNYRKDGSRIWVDLYIAPVRDPRTRIVTHFVGVLYDITEIKRYQDELEHRATHDSLTGLANRNLFNDRLHQGIVQARRYGRALTVAFIDLDHFKVINDSMGHRAGDEVLKLMSERINTCVREGDTVSRLGGDEFVVLLQSPAHEESNYRIAQRMIAAIAAPFTLRGQHVKLTCSIGLAVFPRDGSDAEALLRNADAAMYRAKETGSNQFQFYSNEMNAQISGRLSLEGGLWYALERNGLSCYQRSRSEQR